MVADDPAVSGSPRPTLRGSPGRLLNLTRLGEAGPLPIVRGVLVASFLPITIRPSRRCPIVGIPPAWHKPCSTKWHVHRVSRLTASSNEPLVTTSVWLGLY